MEQKLVSLQDMQARFENLKANELEIACEITLSVTVSIYRGEANDGSVPPLYCHIQYGEESDYFGDLFGSDNEMVHSLEDVSEAFSIPLDSKIWEIAIDDTDEPASEGS